MKDVWRGKIVAVLFNALFNRGQGVVCATLDLDGGDVVARGDGLFLNQKVDK